MPNSLSAFFESKLNATLVNSITYSLIIGSLECSDEMQMLPKIKRETNQVVSETVNFELVRSDALVNSLSVQSFAWFNKPVVFSWGFKTASATNDTFQILTGHVSKMTISKDIIEIGATDKNNIFSTIAVSSRNNPTSFTDYPSEIWWTLVTSYGGLSSINSSSNPDIDYAAWKAWNDKESADANLYFFLASEGSKLLNLQQRVIDFSVSAVFQDGSGKLVPVFWDNRTSPGSMEITDSDIIGDIDTSFQGERIVNRVVVEWYNWFSAGSLHSAVYQNSSSINSWGLREIEIGTDADLRIADVTVTSGTGEWGTASLTAFRKVSIADDPWDLVVYKFKTGIAGIKYLPEDSVTLVTSRDLLGSRELTIRKIEYDLEKGVVDITAIGRHVE